MNHQIYVDILRVLKKSYNLILTGAPGTGKTFIAQKIAAQIILDKEDVDAEQLSEEDRKILEEHCAFVQFHPSYDYTDFVEGLRPVPDSEDNTDIKFERRDGVFKEFCAKAIKGYNCMGGTSGNALTAGVGEDDIERAFRSLWEKIRLGKEDVRTLKMFSGKHTLPMMVEEDKKGTIYFPKKYDHATKSVGNEVTLEKIKKAILDKGICSTQILKSTPYPKSKEEAKEILGSQGNFANTWSVLTYILNHITPDAVPVSAQKAKTPYIFIIDEINRGEASKVFGELFYAIDPGYRGKKDVQVKTQYQNLVPKDDVFSKGFYVPDNVYILATMNDIDRSVESMDFAMRRRFTWREITPEDTKDMLAVLTCAKEAEMRMSRLNDAIAETEELGAAYMVGPSYFLKLKDYDNDFESLWILNIEPLLKEYLRGFRKSNELLKKFKNSFDNSVKTETGKTLVATDEN